MYSINSDKTDETVEILQKANNKDSIASKKKKTKLLRCYEKQIIIFHEI